MDPETHKQRLQADIQLLERARQQKLQMINLINEKVRDLEDEYLDKSLSRFGNVFNGWSAIRPGGTGVSQGFGIVPLNMVLNANTNKTTQAIANPNKRNRKLNDKEKEKERIYVSGNSGDDKLRYGRGAQETSRFDFKAAAEKLSDPKSHVSKRQRNESTRSNQKNQEGLSKKISTNNSANNTSSAKQNGGSSSAQNSNVPVAVTQGVSNKQQKDTASIEPNSSVRKSSRIKQQKNNAAGSTRQQSPVVQSPRIISPVKGTSGSRQREKSAHPEADIANEKSIDSDMIDSSEAASKGPDQSEAETKKKFSSGNKIEIQLGSQPLSDVVMDSEGDENEDNDDDQDQDEASPESDNEDNEQ